MSLLNKIFNSAWCIDSGYVQANLPKIFRLAEGKDVDFGQIDFKPSAVDKTYAVVSQESNGGVRANGTDSKIVAIVPIRGVMMKDDQFCGPRGMESVLSHVKDIAKNDRVGAIIFDFDSPGGQASFLETFANTLQSIEKPTLSHYNSLCCSAAYFLASNTDEIYASESTDIVGSIGTMMSAMNVKGFFKAQGIDIFEVYADQSSDKNGKIRALFEKNDDSRLKNEVLNPFAENFINTVKENRDITDSIVFKGDTFMSAAAQEKGLIDGVKSFEQVVDRAFELIEENETNLGNTNSNFNNMKKLTTTAKLLNIETDIQSQEGKVSLSEDNMESIEDALTNAETATASLETANADLSTATTALETANTDLATANTALTAANARIVELGGEAGAPGANAGAANPPINNGGTEEVEPWMDDNNPINKAADAYLEG